MCRVLISTEQTNTLGPPWGHFLPILLWAQKTKIYICVYFPWWCDRVGLGPCAGVLLKWVNTGHSVTKQPSCYMDVFFLQRARSSRTSRSGADFGNLGTWISRNLKPKNKKMKILKMQVRSAQNVGKVWISRKKNFPAPFGAIPGHFFHGLKKT